MMDKNDKTTEECCKEKYIFKRHHPRHGGDNRILMFKLLTYLKM